MSLCELLQESDWDFLKQVLDEARTEMDNIVAVAKPELAAARDEAEFRAVVAALRTGVETQSEDMLRDGLARAALLKLSTHRSQSVRDTLNAAETSLVRIRKCNELLDSGLSTVNPSQLVEVVSLSSGLGYRSPRVDMAKSLLVRIQEVTKRANYALEAVNRDELAAVLEICDEIGLKSPMVDEVRAVLALPPDQFLRRQLAAAVASGNDKWVVELTMKMKVCR